MNLELFNICLYNILIIFLIKIKPTLKKYYENNELLIYF